MAKEFLKRYKPKKKHNLKKDISISEEIYLISFNNYKKKKILIFRKTCSASPCQYDIYDSWKLEKPVYYGRLRWGFFYVAKAPLCKPIYEFDFKDRWKGFFEDSTEEIEHLKKVCEKIWSKK
jgi:hypothetical protein